MVEIKCSKVQYERLIAALDGPLDTQGRCFLGKGIYTCYSNNNPKLTCEECLRKHIKRFEVPKQC